MRSEEMRDVEVDKLGDERCGDEVDKLEDEKCESGQIRR